MHLDILVFRSRSCSCFLSLYFVMLKFYINILFMLFISFHFLYLVNLYLIYVLILFIYASLFHYVQLSLLCQGEKVTLMV